MLSIYFEEVAAHQHKTTKNHDTSHIDRDAVIEFELKDDDF